MSSVFYTIGAMLFMLTLFAVMFAAAMAAVVAVFWAYTTLKNHVDQRLRGTEGDQ